MLDALGKVLPKYPDIHVEIMIDHGLTNIVAQQVDAGIRPGELVAKDMIAVRVSPDLRMAVVGSPSYFTERKRPKTPQELTHTTASIFACRPTAVAFTRGSSRRTGASSTSALRASSYSIVRPPPRGSAQRLGPCLLDGGTRSAARFAGQARSRAGGLVPALRRLPPLLP